MSTNSKQKLTVALAMASMAGFDLDSAIERRLPIKKKRHDGEERMRTAEQKRARKAAARKRHARTCDTWRTE